MSAADTISRRQSLGRMATGVFGASAGVGIVQIADADPGALFDIEKPAIAGAIPARRREFAAGRQAARLALGQDTAIPMAANRAPVWPGGTTGSVTHAGEWALAVAGAAGSMIGIDLELDEDLPGDIWSTVLTDEERAWVTAQETPGRAARLIFSIKECAYKAQFPRSGQIFGFDKLSVTVAPGDRTFKAVFQGAVAPFRAGDTIAGRFSIGGRLILTGVFQ